MAEADDTTENVAARWLADIEAAKRREKDYRKRGRTVRDLYDGSATDQPFAIVFSNTETMLPALYSQTPRPVVSRRFKDDDKVAKAAATAGERMLEFLLDTNMEGYETFHEAVKADTLDGLLPGRGLSSVRYHDETGDLVCLSHESWDRVYFGYARKWSKVPWVAYEHHFTKAQWKEKFGAKGLEDVEFTTGDDEPSGTDGKLDAEDRNKGSVKTACVYQVWDKDGGRKVLWISPAKSDTILKTDEDPLGLTGFFNCPRPLQFVEKTDDMTPTSLYALYEQQAAELNDITRRLRKLVQACKARGVYDSELGADIENLLESEENELVPADKSSSLAAEKGLDNAIWFMPLDKIIQTIRELYVARENVKQVIYEILGISDILRGASKASETLGAQQIKNQWGSLRLKPKQAEVQRYARDLLRMMLEVAASKFSQDSWVKMTGLPYFTDEQTAAAQQMMAQVQAAAQMGDQAAMQQMQQMQMQLQQVVLWKDVLALLNDDLTRAFKIDIETNSTVEPEAAEDQKQITELLTAIGQFVNGVGPMVQAGVMPFEVAQSMLLAITKRFRFGNEIEDQIKSMQPPKPQDNGAEKKAADAEAASKQKEMQMQAENLRLQQQLNTSTQNAALDKRDAELKQRESDLATREAVFKLEQKVASDSLTQRVQTENSKIEQKKQMVGLEHKTAKDAQSQAKNADTKVAQATTQLQSIVQSLAQSQQKLLEVVAEQAQRTDELLKVAKAPRKRTPKRGPDGRITEVVDEVMN